MRQQTLRTALLLTACALTLSSVALAQQYQILRADYGAGNQRVDVTQKLQQIAAANTQFRMGNSTFGVDPAPGKVKTLRIYARGPDGRNHMFEYVEGSVIDGSRFSGWGSGNWGNGGWNGGWNPSPVRPPVSPPVSGNPGLNILSATYGVPGRTSDVATRLRSMIRNGRLSTPVNNSTMEAIRRVFEAIGVEFTNGDRPGVSLKKN